MAMPVAVGEDFEAEIDDDAALQLDFRLDPRRQVSAQVYELLRKAIVTLRLPPGRSVSENLICRHIGVSRTPVREAIIRLVEDELIEVFPQKGSFVAPIKLSAVRVNHFSRKALELAVLRRAAERWGPAYGSKARFIVDRQGAALGAGDMDEFHALDEAFHRAFCVAADLEGVWTTIQIIKARVDRVHRLAAVRGRLPMVIAEHNAILDSLDSSDAEGALERLEYHLERAPTMLETMIGTHERYFVD
jgi:GntR family transcriptional regulator, rspAB operon transcriptional repressor